MIDDHFYQAYLDYAQGHPEDFILMLERDIVRPFVQKNYFRLHHWLAIKKVEKLTPEIEDDLCHEVLDELFVILYRSHFFDKFLVESNKHNIKSYINKILINSVNLDRYSYTAGKFRRMFDLHGERFYFWLDGVKKRSTDFNSDHKKRNYYLASWTQIPDLLTGRISGRNSFAEFAGNRLLQKLFSEKIAEFCQSIFEKILLSLKIAHFLEFLSDAGFFNNEEESYDEMETTGNLLPTEPTDRMVPEEEQKFFQHFLHVLKNEAPKSLEPFALWAEVILEHLRQSDNANVDFFRLAAERSKGKYSRNSIEYHVKDKRNKKNVVLLFVREYGVWFPDSLPKQSFFNFLLFFTNSRKSK